MPTSTKLRKFKELADNGETPKNGGKIIAEMLKQIDEIAARDNLWSDHHVWPVHSTSGSITQKACRE